MKTFTTCGRWLGLFLLFACFVGSAYGQTRTVTLTLNAATIPDTTLTDSFMEVRGAVNGVSPITLADGNMIDWSDVSTLEPTNIGGDYWQIQFEIADTTDLTFKFYSQQAEDNGLNGWEADPNPNIPPGANDTTLTVHYFESQSEYRGVSGDRGDYDWRPFESKEDSIAVWFRVYMLSEDGVNKGYNSNAGQVIGLRGDNLDLDGDGGNDPVGPLDWGITQVTLERESTASGTPGYDLYSGVAYYPEEAAGETQAYKFVFHAPEGPLDEAPAGWEDLVEGGDRTFTVPAQDSTLYWKTFGNTPAAGAQPVQSAVVFSVDLTPLEQIGIFDIARGDTLQVRGDFNGWDCSGEGAPGDCQLDKVPGAPEYEQVVPVTAIPGAVRNYKFFLDLNNQAFRDEFGVDVIPSGWEEPISTQGNNRTFTFRGDAGGTQLLDPALFNDVLPANIIPDGNSIDVTFSVDMTPALTLDEPFEPAADSVTVTFNDSFWIVTQGMPLTPRDDDPTVGDAVDTGRVLREYLQLTDDDGDMVYTGTLTVTGPTYSGFQYQYSYGGFDGTSTTFQTEAGAGLGSALGRRRTRFIVPNGDGSWPATYNIVQEAYTATGALPFDTNPATGTGIEVIDDEIPDQIALGQNYPNPFNPSTTFEYTIDRTQHVTIRVYDLLGRVVTTLVDGTQPAATYKVTFDASRLASGVYLYQIETPTKAISKRMVLLK